MDEDLQTTIGRIDINSSRDVYSAANGSTWISLDGITFLAEN